MITSEAKQNSLLYSDDSIQAEIWEAVGRYEVVRALDIGSFSISVQEGHVLLTGHVSKKYHHDLIEEIACSISGVSAVQNKLVVDSDLIIQVAQALSRDERTRSFILPVSCSHGWIRLGGVVSSRELQIAAEEIAAQVPSVRGVLSRPRMIGEIYETERLPIQPQIHAKINDYNGQEGAVTQVVIQPRNRLVTHAAVSVNDFRDGKFVSHEYCVPVEAMEVVDQDSVLLKRNGPPLNAFPTFEPSNYPLAPLDWQPPYPYTAGAVRWPCEPCERAENGSSSSRLFRVQK
jgi:osmotically-inducible protein OsmY